MNPFLLTAISLPACLWVLTCTALGLSYWCYRKLKDDNIIPDREMYAAGIAISLFLGSIFGAGVVGYTLDIPMRTLNAELEYHQKQAEVYTQTEKAEALDPTTADQHLVIGSTGSSIIIAPGNK